MNKQFLLYCSRTNETILYLPYEQILITPDEISEVKRDVMELLVVGDVLKVIGEM
jgi:hypothetical protein